MVSKIPIEFPNLELLGSLKFLKGFQNLEFLESLKFLKDSKSLGFLECLIFLMGSKNLGFLESPKFLKGSLNVGFLGSKTLRGFSKFRTPAVFKIPKGFLKKKKLYRLGILVSCVKKSC